MKANLSLVLDKEGNVRLDLLENLEIVKIDEYTTSKSSFIDIREDYKEKISAYLSDMEYYVANFKREADKCGRIVITYTDEVNKVHYLRVLYKENKNKLDCAKLIRAISKTLKEKGNLKMTLSVIEHYTPFIFGAPFDYKEINKVKRRVDFLKNTSRDNEDNKRLIKTIISNHLVHTYTKDNNRGYFLTRLIDAYIEKQGLITTKRIVGTKGGKIEINEVPLEKIILQKKSIAPITKKDAEEFIQDGDYFLESNGQYNLFDKQLVLKNTRYDFSGYMEDYLEERHNK